MPEFCLLLIALSNDKARGQKEKTTSHYSGGKRMGDKDVFTEGTIISFQKLGSSN